MAPLKIEFLEEFCCQIKFLKLERTRVRAKKFKVPKILAGNNKYRERQFLEMPVCWAEFFRIRRL